MQFSNSSASPIEEDARAIPLPSMPVPSPPPQWNGESHPFHADRQNDGDVVGSHSRLPLSVTFARPQEQRPDQPGDATGANSSGTSQWYAASMGDDEELSGGFIPDGGLGFSTYDSSAVHFRRIVVAAPTPLQEHAERIAPPLGIGAAWTHEIRGATAGRQNDYISGRIADNSESSSPVESKPDDEIVVEVALGNAPTKTRGSRLLLILPVDLWSYLLGTFISREMTPTLRLVSRWLNSVVEANCWCWEYRLPPVGMLEAAAEESALTAACRVRQWSASSPHLDDLIGSLVAEGHLDPSSFAQLGNDDDVDNNNNNAGQELQPSSQTADLTWHMDMPAVLQHLFTRQQQFQSSRQRFHNSCHKGCCYRAWLQNTRLEIVRIEREHIESEHFEYASVVAKAVFFPARAGTLISTVLVVVASLSFSVALVLQYYRGFSKVIIYLPLWVFFGLLYPILYLFFCETPVETLVAAAISTIGIVLSVLLQFFYREDATSMSLMSCATPALLCVASLATYAVLLCHRWFHDQNRKSIRVSILVVLTAAIPTLLLLSLALFAAERDGLLGISAGASSSSSPAVEQQGGQNAPVSHSVAAGFFTVQYAALPMVLVSLLLMVNIVHVLTTFGSQDLLHGEPIATVVLIGYAVTWVGLAVLSVFAFTGAETNVVFGFGLALASTFLGATIINVITPKEEASPFSHLLFRFPN